jgi:tripartite ATP-independent transporter DctM subunit
MGAVIALAVVIALMVLGVPVAFSFAAMTLTLAIVYEIDISTLLTTGFWSVNSVILMALPLFIMTGYLMQQGGMAARLVDFVESLVGHVRGGLGVSLIVACGIFGAISGTATAAVASIGTVLIDPMERRGYPRAYSSALLGVSSLLGILIPPSITMILFAVVTRQSVAACFLATVGPGLLLIVVLCLVNGVMCRRMPSLVVDPPIGLRTRARRTARATALAFPALLMPIIILGGIYGGVFTPTEAAAVAVVYAVPIGFLVYRGLRLSNFARSLVDAAETTGVIIVILLFSFVASRILTLERIPQELTELMLSVFQSKVLILLMVNAFLVFMGMIMDDVSVTVILSPILLPTMVEIGVEPVHFAAIVGTSVVIGANSPPVAPILYMACRIGRVTVAEIISPAVIFMVFAALPVMLVTTYWPSLALFLPRAFGFLK